MYPILFNHDKLTVSYLVLYSVYRFIIEFFIEKFIMGIDAHDFLSGFHWGFL